MKQLQFKKWIEKSIGKKVKLLHNGKISGYYAKCKLSTEKQVYETFFEEWTGKHKWHSQK